MTFNRVRSVWLFVCLAVSAPTAEAQNQVTPASGAYVSPSAGVATAGDFSGSYLFGNDGGTYFLFDKMIGDGPGYGAGYSRFGMRVKLLDHGDSHLWGSGYALITDEMRVGVNLGGGYRWLYDGNIIGVHGWYDSYETDFGNRYTQATAGFELLHEEVDLRVNGYMPFGDTENFIGVTDPGIIPVFTSRGIGFLGRGIEEQALKGIDAEVGTAIFAIDWARVYAGGYWYEGRTTSFGGGRGRIETAISPDLSLNFIVQNDTEFNTNYNLSVEYRFSGGLSPGLCTPFHGAARKYNPVRRQWPIATQAVDIPTTVPMLNPKTGGIMTAAFIDNRNGGPGDGSFENPFSDLPTSVDADKIFVFTGDGGPIFGNITLRPEQQLLGEGKLYTFNDPLRGPVSPPIVFRSSGERPLLVADNPAQNVVTLASWTRVANFDIQGPAAAAIGGRNISGFEIDMVSGVGTTDGVNIINASGPGVIRNSDFQVLDQGIFVSNTSGAPLNLLIQGQTSVATTSGGREGIHVVADGADVNVVLDTVNVNNATGAGITLDASLGAILTADVDDARVFNTGGTAGNGFVLNVNSGATMAVDLSDVSARGNGDLFVVDVRDGRFFGTVAGGVPGILAGADFSDSTTGSGVRVNLDDAVGRLTFNSLFANRNAVNGIETLASGDGTDFLINVLNSRLINNTGSAFSTDVRDGADLRYVVNGATATLSGGSGFEYDVRGGGSVFIADIIQTDFTDSLGHGVSGNLFNGAFANVDLQQVRSLNAGLNGYDLTVDRNSDFRGTIDDAHFNFAGDAAIDLAISDGSSANLTMTQVQGHTNGDYGLRFLVEDGVNGPSDLFLAVTDGDFNDNPISNISGTARGAGSLASVYLTQVTADDTAVNGSVALTAEDGGILNTTWNLGSISIANGDGVIAAVDGPGSQIRLSLNSVGIGTNGGDGIDGTITNGGANSLLDISLVNSAVSQNTGNGIDLDLSGPGALGRLTINNTPITQNFGGDGLEFDVTGGAALLASAFGPASSFVGNGARAWDGSVSGAGSLATLNFDGTDAVGLGLEGGLFEVSAGGVLNLNLSNLTIAENPLDGLLTTVDGAGSRANIVLDQVNMSRNGLSLLGDAFEARASNGGLIMATLSNMNVTQNREDAFLFDASSGGIIRAGLSNVIADNNGRHGLEYHASGGGQFEGGVTSSSFSNEGSVFVGDGVYGTATGAGSIATAVLQGVTADNNGRMGFEFDVRGGATLLGDIRSNGTFGNSSGSGNAINGVRFNAQDAGTMGFLKMMGPNSFNGNGADGINYDAVGVNMAVAQVTGEVNNNGADGINIRMINVTSGAISLQGAGTATITGNGDDGIDITTQNVALIDKTVNGMLIPAFQIDGFTITGNGGDPIVIDMQNTTIQGGTITGNTIDGGLDGINVHLGAGDGDLLIDGNIITGAQRYGIAVTSDAGTHQVKITNNSVTTSGDTNIFVDLFGSAEAGLMINGNTLIGGGSATASFSIGTNFTGQTRLTSPLPPLMPPDTMGGVGRDHIVEILNNGYAVYDKATGTQLFSSTLEQFWTDAGLPPLGANEIVTDPRIVFDPTVDRWFAISIDADVSQVGAASNNILVAVSRTEDPLDGFIGLEFVADTIDANRLADYPTLGIDAEGIYIGTNNFNPGFSDVAVYSIPKADLLAAVPTLANLTRFEASDPTIYGTTLQGAIDFGPADGIAHFLASNENNVPPGSPIPNLIRADIFGAAGPGAILSAPTSVAVTPYQPGPPGDQPLAGFQLDNVSPRFGSNIVKVGSSLWAAHSVLGVSGNAAVRWYEIDAVANAIIQSGTIEDPALDFLDPSIAVNQQGVVVIGFTGTGPTQSASAMAVLGVTDSGGTTSFQTPIITQMGTGSYATGFPTSRWGDYSATVVDPDDPNSFWTFQQFANGFSDYGIQITQFAFQQAVLGGTANDGIHVDVRDNAHLLDSMINNNIATQHSGEGIEVVVTDAAVVDDLMINGNETSINGGDGIRFEKTSTGTLASLGVNSNMSMENSGDGIEVLIDGPSGTPDLMVNGNMVIDNFGRGIVVTANDTSVDDVSVSLNTVRDNQLGNGILVDINNMSGGVRTADTVVMRGNMVSGSPGTGVLVNLNNLTGLSLLDVSMSNISDNMGGGLEVRAVETPITTVNLDSNTIATNSGGDGILLDMLNSPVDTLNITRNSVSGNTGNGVNLDLDGSPIGTLNVTDNNTGGTSSGIGLTFVIGGNTFGTPFTITNSSAPGNDITNFMLDLSTAVPNPAGIVIFDTQAAGAPIAFQPQANTDVLTGLLSVNGTAITPGTNPLQDAMGNVLPGGGVPDDSQLIDLAFGDFNPLETFQWLIDVDFITLPGSTVLGSDLIGSSIRVDFTGGQFLTGALSAIPGNPMGSTFVATGGTISGAAGLSDNVGDGLRINATNGSDIGAFLLDNNVIDGNSMHGVELLVSDSTLPAVGMPTIVSNNTITNNSGDGFRLINPDTNDTPFQIDFTDNIISNNTGLGINIELNANSGGMTSVLTGNEISNNGSIGASFVIQDDATLDLTFGNSLANANVVTGNVDAGIAVKTKDMSVADIVVENTTVSGTIDGPNAAFNGDGLAVQSSGDSLVRTMTVGDDMLRNTSFLANAGNGIDIELTDNARNPNILIRNVMANNNAVHGIGITRSDFSSFTEDLDSDGVIDPGEDVNADGMLGNAVITMSSANGNGGNGLDVSVSGAQLPVQQIDVVFNQNSFNNNTIGMNFVVNNDAVLLVDAANNIVSGNSSHGISVTTNQNSAFGNILPSMGDPNSPLAVPSTFSSNIVTSNGGNGFNFVANGSSVQVIDVDDAGAVNPSTGTSRTVIDGNTGNQVQITGNGTSQQNIDLIAVNITNVNNVTTGDGVNIDANGMSTVNVTIDGGITGPAIIGAAIAHVSVPGLGGPGMGVANGIAADVANQAILNLDVSNTRLYNNTGDGIVITNSAPGGLNGSDVGFSGGNRQTIQATFDNVDARLNGDQGLDVRLTGNVGGRAAQGDTDMPILIDVTNSTFSNNTNEGIFFQTNTGFTQNAEVQIVNPSGPAQNPLFNTINGPGGGRDGGGFTNGFNQGTRSGQFNVGRYDGVDFEWNNMYTDLVAYFNVTNSTITSNGSASISDGLVMRVSTNSYVGSNVSGNTFGANGADDFHTESFITTDAAGNPQMPNQSVDNVAPAFDMVFLDDTAQMDLAFQNNSGDHIRPSALGAFYTNADPAKQMTRPNSPTMRRADIFILDNALTVEPNNMFQLFGVPQMEVFGPDGFFTNGYFLRPMSNHLDPNFPPP